MRRVVIHERGAAHIVRGYHRAALQVARNFTFGILFGVLGEKHLSGRTSNTLVTLQYMSKALQDPCTRLAFYSRLLSIEVGWKRMLIGRLWLVRRYFHPERGLLWKCFSLPPCKGTSSGVLFLLLQSCFSFFLLVVLTSRWLIFFV